MPYDAFVLQVIPVYIIEILEEMYWLKNRPFDSPSYGIQYQVAT